MTATNYCQEPVYLYDFPYVAKRTVADERAVPNKRATLDDGIPMTIFPGERRVYWLMQSPSDGYLGVKVSSYGDGNAGDAGPDRVDITYGIRGLTYRVDVRGKGFNLGKMILKADAVNAKKCTGVAEVDTNGTVVWTNKSKSGEWEGCTPESWVKGLVLDLCV